jgi:hypothetical protein
MAVCLRRDLVKLMTFADCRERFSNSFENCFGLFEMELIVMRNQIPSKSGNDQIGSIFSHTSGVLW